MAVTPVRNILLLTLVHPDFLPPVYAVGQVLRDEGYNVHILTFDSFVPAHIDLGENVTVETLGNHHQGSLSQRLALRRKFKQRAAAIVDKDDPVAIISFCPFTLLAGLRVRGNKPLIYHALEIADFWWSTIMRSPLTQINHWATLRRLHRADLVCTPSIQRSAWLAGRCHLNTLPTTVLNAAYMSAAKEADAYSLFAGIVPDALRNKKIVLYNGAVNARLCVLEIVQAFCMLNDANSALVVTGIKDNEYCSEIKQAVATSACADRVLLLPYVTRAEMLALQAHAHIGVSLNRESEEDARTKMIAPNKVGEYYAKGLYLLACNNEYMQIFGMKGIASLAASVSKEDVAIAMKQALEVVGRENARERVMSFVSEYYSMQQQAKPIVQFIKKLARS